VLVEFHVVPVGKGESMGDEIARVLDIVERSGLPYRVNPMGTVIEGQWDEVIGVIKRCHDEVLKSAPRVISSITIDDRPSRPMDRITEKVRSIEKRLGRELEK